MLGLDHYVFGCLAHPSRRTVTCLAALYADRATTLAVGCTDHKGGEDWFYYRSIIWGSMEIF